MQTELIRAQSEYNVNACSSARDPIGKARSMYEAALEANPGSRSSLAFFEQQWRQSEITIRACLPR